MREYTFVNKSRDKTIKAIDLQIKTVREKRKPGFRYILTWGSGRYRCDDIKRHLGVVLDILEIYRDKFGVEIEFPISRSTIDLSFDGIADALKSFQIKGIKTTGWIRFGHGCNNRLLFYGHNDDISDCLGERVADVVFLSFLWCLVNINPQFFDDLVQDIRSRSLLCIADKSLSFIYGRIIIPICSITKLINYDGNHWWNFISQLQEIFLYEHNSCFVYLTTQNGIIKAWIEEYSLDILTIYDDGSFFYYKNSLDDHYKTLLDQILTKGNHFLRDIVYINSDNFNFICGTTFNILGTRCYFKSDGLMFRDLCLMLYKLHRGRILKSEDYFLILKFDKSKDNSLMPNNIPIDYTFARTNNFWEGLLWLNQIGKCVKIVNLRQFRLKLHPSFDQMFFRNGKSFCFDFHLYSQTKHDIRDNLKQLILGIL